jgi:hypothetical protein
MAPRAVVFLRLVRLGLEMVFHPSAQLYARVKARVMTGKKMLLYCIHSFLTSSLASPVTFSCFEIMSSACEAAMDLF